MSDKKIYFITGGGTGGHIYPAFTVVEKLLKQDDTEKIYYIGNPKNLEYDISKQYPDVQFLPVNVSGMPRKLSFSFFKWSFQIVLAIIKTIFYMKKYKPNAVFATGGYVSAPLVIASQILKHPYMIHDCDSVPGIVSKISAPKAQVVSVAFEASKNVLKSNNIICNGNPVREAFFIVTKHESKNKLNIPYDKKVIFATGGSQGAKTINDSMIKLLKPLSEDMNYFVILQTGKKNYENVINELENIYPEFQNNKNLLIKPYFDESVYTMKAADIVISRAGSVSLSEIIQCAAVSVLIPYPYAAQDHQRKNAKEMCEKGVSLYLEDSECNDITLMEKIKELTPDKLLEMSKKTKLMSKSNPTEEIVNQLKSTIK